VPAVEVVDLSKEFLRRQGRRRVRVTALAGVSLTVARGECVAVLGQNGSGKSTLVRVLSTLLLHDRGSVRVFGHDVVRDDQAVRRIVNRVSVEASFFKRMSATENLSYAARFYGMAPGHTRRRIPRSWPPSGSRRRARRCRWRTSRAGCSRRSRWPARC
jgi:ABC-2 type transport system ATP-binding protein